MATGLFAAWNLAVIGIQLADGWRAVHDTDFYLFWFAARFAESHGWAALYDGHSEVAALHAAAGRADVFRVLPPAIWLALPFAALPYPAALVLWEVVLAAAMVAAWAIAAPGGPWARAALLTALFASYPAAWELLNSHPTAIVMLAVAGGWLLLRSGRPVGAGLLLGAILIKPQSAFLVPVALLVAGRWRTAAGAALAAGLLLTLSVVLVGPAAAREHLFVLSQAIENTDARRFTLYGLVGGGPLDGILTTADALVALGAAWMARKRGPEIPIAAGIAGSLAATPYAYPYELMTLFLAGWLVLRSAPPSAARWALLPIYVAVAFPQLLTTQVAVVGELAFLVWVVAVSWWTAKRDQDAVAPGAGTVARATVP